MSKYDFNNGNDDIMLDLEIPLYIYVILFFIIIIIIIFRYIYSTEEIFDFIDKSKKESLKQFSNNEEKLNLLTKLNTKINRDYLDNSKYYHDKGYNKIYGNMEEINKNKNADINDSKANEKIIIKRHKKVGFSDNIIYESEF